MSFDSLSITSGAIPVLLFGLTGVAVATTLLRRRTHRNQLLIGVPAAVLVTVVIALVVGGLDLIPYSFPLSFYAWIGLPILAIALGAAGWRQLRNWQRGVALLSVPLAATSCFVLINQHYQYWPTVGSVLGVEAQHEATETAIEKMHDLGPAATVKNGYTVQVNIPAPRSGFKAAPAEVWLPPAWFSDHSAALPVIELIGGAPGSPTDWTRAAFADQTAQAFADAHHGLAPILVMPDANGPHEDSECVDSQLGNAETYLTQDVPDYIVKQFGTAPTGSGWAIAGLSAGGMCAGMLALRHPTEYAAFADYAGLTGPTVQEYMDPSATTQQLFGGSSAAYDDHQIPVLLQSHPDRNLGAWFQVGTADAGPYAAQRQLVPLARAAGLDTCAAYIPNASHDFTFFGDAFRDSLPWLSHRLGLTPAPTGESPATCSA